MTSITLTQIVEAIADTLDGEPTLNEVQWGETLAEAIENMPMAQVYWDGGSTDVASQNDRTTFRAGVRQAEINVIADVFVCPRAHIGQGMAAVMVMAETINGVLEAQKVPPFFGLDGIKSFRWRVERVTIEYSNVQYDAARFTITVRVY